jgi:hypothetical protein
MKEIQSGRRPFVRLDVLHRENLVKVMVGYGVDMNSIAADELDELNLAWHRLDPWSDSVEGLLRLKRRFIIAPLSNGNIRLMLDMAKRAERWRRWFGQSDRVYKWKRRGHQAADLIAGSVAKYASSGV